MFKGYNNRQQHGFPNLNFFGDKTAYGQGGCNFWLRADFGLNTQTNLGAVSRWVDYINGVAFIQGTAGNQPRLLTSNISYNNLPVVEFFDTTRIINIESGTTPFFRSIAFIANYDSLSSSQNRLISNSASTNAIYLGGQQANINGITNFVNNTIYSGTTENTSIKICVISDNMIMVNGIIENSQSITIQSNYNFIGGTSSGAMLGKVAEIIGYTQPLNSDQATAISNQLNAKYLIY